MTETPTPPAAEVPASAPDYNLMAMLAHLSMILLGVVGPLIFWLIGKDKSEFQKDQSTEALNFSIIGTIATIVTCGIAWIVMAIFAIIGGIAANKGERYRYPFNWRIVK